MLHKTLDVTRVTQCNRVMVYRKPRRWDGVCDNVKSAASRRREERDYEDEESNQTKLPPVVIACALGVRVAEPGRIVDAELKSSAANAGRDGSQLSSLRTLR